MDKKILAALVAGILVGAIGGALAVSAVRKDRYHYFTSSNFPQGGRINTDTGETWLLGQDKSGSMTWLKIPETR